MKGSEHPDAAEAARLKQTSCDVNASVVCMHAWAGGYRLSKDFYVGDRAMRESGFDPSNRFGPFSGATHHFAPVCLNSLLYRYERDLEHLAHLLGKPEDAAHWDRRAQAREYGHSSLSVAAERRACLPTTISATHARRLMPTSHRSIRCGPAVATREEAKQMVDKLEPVRAAGRLVDEQHQHRPAVG